MAITSIMAKEESRTTSKPEMTEWLISEAEANSQTKAASNALPAVQSKMSSLSGCPLPRDFSFVMAVGGCSVHVGSCDQPRV
jgi:hypothetical protein